MPSYQRELDVAIAAAMQAGELLRSELHRSGGPRGSDGHAPADAEAESLIRTALLEATDWSFLGEETGVAGKPAGDTVWIVDPNDGTSAFLQGRRGSAVSIAAIRGGEPILGVVFAFAYPDDAGDLIAWAQGSPVTRNGLPVPSTLANAALDRYSMVLLSQKADRNPAASQRCVAPGRFLALPSIAYRLALVGAGEGVVAVSTHGPVGWDYAGGHAIVVGAGGVFVNESGGPIVYSSTGQSQASSCFGGAPAAVRRLLRQPWKDASLAAKAAAEGRFSLPAKPGVLERDPGVLTRAQGCLLGQLAGDALGQLVEFKQPDAIRGRYPKGVAELVDGGTWNTIAGQPTDDSELALMLGRSIIERGRYDPRAAVEAYAHWYRSGPFDCGPTTTKALDAAASALAAGKDPVEAAQQAASRTSQSNGSLMRVSVLGIHCARRPEKVGELARLDSSLTHPHPLCQEACAAFTSAIAVAIGRGGTPQECLEAALRATDPSGVVRTALERAGAGSQPDNPPDQQGGGLIAIQNAFYQLLHAPSLRDGIVATVMIGGDTDTNAAIAGALLGAVHGRYAVPLAWRNLILSCRPIPEVAAKRPRPREFWPIDALELAEALLAPEHEMIDCVGTRGRHEA